jgi:hypothetical protein
MRETVVGAIEIAKSHEIAEIGYYGVRSIVKIFAVTFLSIMVRLVMIVLFQSFGINSQK